MLIMTLVCSNFNWTKDSWKHIVEADAKGYYAYLPATFIYKDLNYNFFDKIEKEKYYNVNTFYDYRCGSNGKVINKYYCGTALAQMPFFLAAHGYAKIAGKDADGFSKPYMLAVSIGALFYLLFGLIFLNATLKLYEIGEWTKAWVLMGGVFGTNLFYYTVCEPGLSHIVSFTFVSAFCYYAKLYFVEFKSKQIIILCLLTGIIILVRPVNGLIVFSIPFFAGNLESLKDGFRFVFQRPFFLIIGIVGGIGIIFIQMIIYKISIGSFFVYSYGEEGFHFLAPHFWDILFSYKKGLFLYTPVYLLSFGGLIYLFRKNKFQFFSWSIFFLLITYVFSSWWMWFYGGSFSSRVYVEFLPMFMILLALFIHHQLKKLYRTSILFVLTVLIIICQIQTFQYRYYEIHWSDMNKEKYWAVFLCVDRLINKETNPAPPVK